MASTSARATRTLRACRSGIAASSTASPVQAPRTSRTRGPQSPMTVQSSVTSRTSASSPPAMLARSQPFFAGKLARLVPSHVEAQAGLVGYSLFAGVAKPSELNGSSQRHVRQVLERLETVTRAGQRHLMNKIVAVLTSHPLIAAAGPFVAARVDDLRRDAEEAAPDGGAKPDSGGSPPTQSVGGNVTLDQVAEGLTSPVTLTESPDNSGPAESGVGKISTFEPTTAKYRGML